MKFSRREVMISGGAIAAASTMGGCAAIARHLPDHAIPDSLAPPSGDVHPTVRLLNRAGFGPRPGEVEQVEQMGREKWLDSQLNPAGEQGLRLKTQLMRLDVLAADGMELRDLPEDLIVRELNQAALLRAVYSDDTLYERMVDFWTNHFNLYARKGLMAYRVAQTDHDVIRKNALGKFPDLLSASAHGTGMLAYLDNQANRKESPNENYARELMELHTLGVRSGYTQRDVHEVARCFTGWGIELRLFRHKGSFYFNPNLHDDGQKVVLGNVILAGGGQEDGERVLEILSNDPRTASFVAGKMCRHFLGDKNHPMRPELARIYTGTGGDIRSMLRPLLLSDAALNGPAVAKRPLDFVVSAIRAVGADSDCGPDLQQHLARMGQSLYEWPMPDGYPDGAQPWTGSLLARWNFSLALAQNRIGGTQADLPNLVKRTGTTGPAEAAQAIAFTNYYKSARISDTLSDFSSQQPDHLLALCLSSPEFQWR